ncbi:glutamate-rich protein 6B [Microcaecilia unicolor]|uniref:Glutamate-rich protein 6B n=1 Tax=Microcaecilia unicolor TaxID=1415580 RepID=A0A6P7Y049_9AMPH|nr:glutamate-rich protein 6B [Microcaecilia unicolor]XP_030056370.1 glutamate-rich protein 6B [Microcaecilia unicolor]XP_030056371.1 glutamate-rich protein 6B [Microcaecilia unicolor]XP_030056372.1 glutamate-rich protein 6B [Microcaecilia unicolor]
MHSDTYRKDGQDGENESSLNPSSSQDHIPPEPKPLVLLLSEENVKNLEKEYEEATGSLSKCSMQEYLQHMYFSKMDLSKSSGTGAVNISEERDPGVSPQTPQWEEDGKSPWQAGTSSTAETPEQEFWTMLPTHSQDGSSSETKSSVYAASSFVSSGSLNDNTPDSKGPLHATAQTQTDWSSSGSSVEKATEWLKMQNAEDAHVKNKSKGAKSQGRTVEKVWTSKNKEDEQSSYRSTPKNVNQAEENGKKTIPDQNIHQRSSKSQPKRSTAQKVQKSKDHKFEESTASEATTKDISTQSQSPPPFLKKPIRVVQEGQESVTQEGVEQLSQKTEVAVDGETAEDTSKQAQLLTPTLKKPKRADKEEQDNIQWKGVEHTSQMTETTASGGKIKDTSPTTVLKKPKRAAKNLLEIQEESEPGELLTSEEMEGDINKQSFTNLKKYKRTITKLQESQVLQGVNSQSALQLSESFSNSEINQQQNSRFLKRKRSLKRLQNAYEPQQVKVGARREHAEADSSDEVEDTSTEAHSLEKKPIASSSEQFKKKMLKGHVSAFKSALQKSVLNMASMLDRKISFRLSEAKNLWSSFPVEEEEEPDDLFMSAAIIQTKYLKKPNEAVRKFYPSGKIFFIFFPDGTGQVHYPSGRVAIMIIRDSPNHIAYIILEDQAMEQPVRAVFKSDGHATCYQQNKLLWLNLKPTGGYYFDKDGKTLKRWSWWDFSQHIHAPPFQSINMKINANIRIRVISQDQIYLIFSKKDHLVGFNIGAKLTLRDQKNLESPKAQICKIEHYLHLQTAVIRRLLQQIHNMLKHPTRHLVETLRPQDLIVQFQKAKKRQESYYKKKNDSSTSIEQIPPRSKTAKPYSTNKRRVTRKTASS